MRHRSQMLLMGVGIAAVATICPRPACAHHQPTRPESRTGEAVFAQLCIGCHGTDGKGQTDMGRKVQAADLTASTVQRVSDSKLTGVIQRGQKKMPAFEDKLSSDEMRAVVAYIRELGNR